jgi:PhnB protein
MADVRPAPEGYPRVSPYLIVDGAAAAIDFYAEVLGARERMRMPGAPGAAEQGGHAELEIGDSLLMLADEHLDVGAVGPRTVGGTPVTLSVYVDGVDAVWAAALAAGANAQREPEDQFYGDRVARFEDPWGHRWHIATHVEDVSPEDRAALAADAPG